MFLCSFGLAPAGPLQVLTPVGPNQSIEVALPLSTVGPVMKMEPLTNLQVTASDYLLPLNCARFGFCLWSEACDSEAVNKMMVKCQVQTRGTI